MNGWLSGLGPWITGFGIVCLFLSWLIKRSDHKRAQARNMRIWNMLPKETKEAYGNDPNRPQYIHRSADE